MGEIIHLRELLYTPSVNTLRSSRGCNGHFCKSMFSSYGLGTKSCGKHFV